MTIRLKSILFLLAALAGTGLVCTHDGPVAGIEVTNGDCKGTIYNMDSTAAAGAVVRLIPVTYDPRDPSTGTVDSTTTDDAGQYAFDVDTSAFYNIIAEKGATSCMLDSVAVQVDGTTTANDTLRASGKLSGRIMLKPEDDPRSTVILIMGTNIYVAPDDSAGNFPEVQLPAGNFTVKAFATGNGYRVFDSTLTVTSGKTTELIVRIPTNYTAEINNFKVTLDSATLYTKLTWSPADTSQLLSYAVHRTTSGRHDTLIAANRNLSSYTDDCIGFFGDSVVYEIAAVGKNFKEGYRVGAPPIVICGKTRSIDKTPLNNYTYGDQFRCVSVNSNKDIYLDDGRSIIKIDAAGKVLKEVRGSDLVDPDLADTGSLTINSTMTDTLGHIYAYISYSNKISDSLLREMTTEEFLKFNAVRVHVIKKFDSDLKVIAELIVPDSLICRTETQSMRINFSEVIVIGDDGSVYLQSYCAAAGVHSTKIRVYDAAFKFRNEFIVNSEISIQCRHGDTIIATSPKYPDANAVDDAASLRLVKIFDASFNLLSSFEATDVFSASYSRYIAKGYRPVSKVMAQSSNIYLTRIDSDIFMGPSDGITESSEILTVSDHDGTLLGRYLVPGDLQLSFQSPHVIYGISHFFGSTLYKLSLTPFLNN